MPAAMPGQKNQFPASQFTAHDLVRGVAIGCLHRHRIQIADAFQLVQSASADDAEFHERHRIATVPLAALFFTTVPLLTVQILFVPLLTAPIITVPLGRWLVDLFQQGAYWVPQVDGPLAGYWLTGPTSTAMSVYDITRGEGWWRDTESNCGHEDFQSSALPTELSRHTLQATIKRIARQVCQVRSDDGCFALIIHTLFCDADLPT